MCPWFHAWVPTSCVCQVEEKFEQVRCLVRGKPYERHIVSQLYAVENSLQDADDEQVTSHPQSGSYIPNISSAVHKTNREGAIHWISDFKLYQSQLLKHWLAGFFVSLTDLKTQQGGLS